MSSTQPVNKQAQSIPAPQNSNSNNEDRTPELQRSRSRLTTDLIQTRHNVTTPGPAILPIKNPENTKKPSQ